MNDYSYGEILRMQEEAKQRVMDMKKRSRSFADSFSSSAPGNAVPDKPKAVSLPVEYDRPFVKRRTSQCAEREKTGVKEENKAQKKEGLPSALKKVFGELGDDGAERMFILSLCLLLVSENCDDELILSLMYLLT